jgi:hypothetical protein
MSRDFFVRFLEETSLVSRLAAAAVVFDGEHAMTGRTSGPIRVRINGAAPRAGASVPLGRSFEVKRVAAGRAGARMPAVGLFVERPAGGADENV